MRVAEGKRLVIADQGIATRLSFEGALDFHQGNSYWGCALAFRVLQLAGTLLSRERLWERTNLAVISGHPGPGVRDTFEYITGCVSRHRFELSCSSKERRCVRDMQFEWEIDDGSRRARIRLRDDFVPESFFDLLDRLDTAAWRPGDDKRLDRHKSELTQRIWETPLEQAFPNASLVA